MKDATTNAIIIKSALEMEELGKKLSAELGGGDVILLTGELGAGKTVFCKGVARGLGIAVPVVSPTFTLMNEYFGTTKFCHFDAYRLSGEEEAYGAGLSDFIGNESCICAVEWWENIAGMFCGLNTIKVTIEKCGNDQRKVRIER